MGTYLDCNKEMVIIHGEGIIKKKRGESKKKKKKSPQTKGWTHVE